MNLLSPFSHAAVAFGMLNPWYGLSPEVRDRVSLVGAITLVTLGLLLWAMFIRKRRRRRHHSHHQHSSTQARLRSGQSNEASEDPHHHHGPRGRRRRHHRPRNPTLAETGGLPPRRTREPHETAV